MDDENRSPDSVTIEFGQYEPLTTRLHNLLKEYKDGFSVPKELIQNAEDAGATEVCFLYDERQNLDARTDLISSRLDEFQGPALWAYNNREFTPQDFQNIRKLGGATKEEDTSKVGKFGLGFNSVYNLTDLPSFISGNQAVIFDPHSKYLGKLGLSTNLGNETNVTVVRRWKNQLKPYDGVFGCRLESQGKICDGTLFRFPLRTESQANRSEIKNLSYSHQQMRNFFSVFARYAGSLLLFTQNVQSVKFYFLPGTGRPEQGVKLVDVRKTVLHKHLVSQYQFLETREMNILEYSSKILKQMPASHDLQCIDEQNKIQVIISEHPFVKACRIVPVTNQITWQIAWSAGNADARKFANSSHLKGLVPVAAVAVPLKTVHPNKERVCLVSDCGRGFYQKGHLFCFMPLPITTEHMIHINATFALTSDRRQLCIQNTDDTDAAEANWNKVLETHVVPDAWANVLNNLSPIGHIDESIYYTLWPLSDNFINSDEIMKSFYSLIVQRDLKVFCQGNGKKWLSYTEILLLDPGLRADSTVGDIAFSTLKKYLDGVEGWVIDLPKNVIKSFYQCGLGDAIEEKTISKERFFKEIFFVNISEILLSDKERDKLTLYALKSTNSQLRQMVRQNRCVPTKPHGKLKMPKELVSIQGQTANLYLEEEEVFPKGTEFCTHPALKCLESLGMIVDELSSQKVIERAHLIQKEKLVDLARHLLKYLNKYSTTNPNKRRFQAYPGVQKILESTKFLPVLKKPPDWPFAWEGESVLFSAPSNMYQTDLLNLLGCCEYILDSVVLELSASGSDVLKWLGVKSRSMVEVMSPVKQLQYLSSVTIGEGSKSMGKLSQICHTVYRFLDDYCGKCKRSVRHSQSNKIKLIQDCLQSRAIILASNKLIEPRKMAFNLVVPLKPYLYEVDEELSHQYPHFLKTIGIREHFEQRDILDVILIIINAAHGGPLRGEVLKSFCKAVQILADLIGNYGSAVPEIQLPDIEGHLHKANQLCLNDCGWIHSQKHMLFLHPSISPKDGQTLGVRTKREASLAKHITAIPQARGFGQHEPLTSRLKRILDGYPKDASVLKELLQNADDAGATELMFIKDFRSHPHEKVFGDEWKQLQGPALCVFNNSHFTKEDFIGIQSLGEGSKGHDPLKTGQYGVGFNVVYHLTDVPSFMTVGPGTEKTLCVLDPHQCYTPRTEEGTPGIQFSDLHFLRQTFKDVFGCYFEDSVMKRDKGTLFRFPLRTEAMADTSKISRHATTTTQLEHMLDTFKEEAWSSMLFLTSVKKISVASVTSSGKLSYDYTVEASLPKADQEKQQTYISTLKRQVLEHDVLNMNPFQIQVIKTLRDSRNDVQNWLVVHQLGFDKSLPIPDNIRYYWGVGEIHLLPRGGVAVPLNQTKSFRGKFFCVLPLPKTTNLPVHVNGHFSLGHEARRDLWHGTNDYRVLWNEHITEAIICPSYIAALKTLQTLHFPESAVQSSLDLPLKGYYRLFPCLEKATDSYVKLLIRTFYTTIIREHIALFPVFQPKKGTFLQQSSHKDLKIEWVPVAAETGFPGYFNTFGTFLRESEFVHTQFSGLTNTVTLNAATQPLETSTQRERRLLAWLLKDLGMKIIESSPDIQRQFEQTDYKDHVKGTSPPVVINFLNSSHETVIGGCHIGDLPQLVSNTLIQSVGNVQLLTKFCQMDSDFAKKMINLPLMATQSQILSRFSENEEYLVTRYNDLFPKSANQLLHTSLVPFYEKMQTDCLKRMDISCLSDLMEENLDKTSFKTGKPIQWNDTPSQLWICRLWKFLSYEVKDQSDKLKKEKTKQTDDNTAINHIRPIAEWSLIPTVLSQVGSDGNLTEQTYLYPVKSSQCVISLHNSSNESFAKVLRKVCLPKLWESAFMVDKYTFYGESLHLCKQIVADMRDAHSMLVALTETSGRESNLSISECCTVMQYFSDNLSSLKNNVPDLSSKLSGLSYFPTLSGLPVSVNDYEQVHVVKDRHPYIPEAGLENLLSGLERALIIHKSYYEKILQHLGLPQWSKEKTYIEIIVPHLMTLEPEARMKHLLHIRDHIKSNAFSHSDDVPNLLERLKSVPFIVTSDGQEHTASDFYSQKVPEFRAMCHENAFLPPPYDHEDWQYFLEKIGLKCLISVYDFVVFAKGLETESQHGITDRITEHSQLLVEHLQRRPQLLQEGLLQKIRNIHFILPYNIEDDEDDGHDLKAIHTQYENARKLVSYSDSCNPGFYHSVWTSCAMWTSDADICRYLNKNNAEKAHKQLDMSKEPTVDVLVGHLQNISSTLKKKDILFKHQNRHILETVFSKIYQLLQKHKQNLTMYHRLQAFPTVYLVEQCDVVAASDVVIDLSQAESVPGYIFKAPTFFGNFFSLFESLGAQNSVSANTYAVILEKLYKKTHGHVLNPNELKIVSKSLFNLIGCLSTTEKANIQTDVLYLPDADCILKDASSIVYNDRYCFAERLKNLTLSYFIGFEALDLQIYNLPQFPDKFSMVPLSKIVQERLTPTCLASVSHSGNAQNYEQRIKSSQFVKGILRICSHQCQNLCADVATEIEHKLTLINIRHVEELETVLVYNGEGVSQSEQRQECFISTDSTALDETVTVYLSGSRTRETFVLFKIATAIDRLTDYVLGRFTSVVEKMLVSEPENIDGILDECRIKKYTYKSTRSSTVFPKVGTLIPDEFHWMLDNSFTWFQEGEYVGLDVYDPFLDDQRVQGANLLPVYVYAVVVKVEDNTSPVAATYLVEVEEEVTKTVSATMLYKFHREKENTTTDMVPSYGNLALDSPSLHIRDILKNIRKQLQGAWDMLKPSERKRVRLRLLSVWHPDRNPENIQMCTEVCQYIGLYIQRLENGESLDVDDIPHTSFDSSFYNEVSRRTNLQRQFRKNGVPRSSTSCHHATRNKAYPHLGEAQRWLRQAQKDLEAGRHALSTMTFDYHNWTCYKSHQAGEKALKAVLYTVDSVRADELKVHRLTEIASALDTQLQTLARKLDSHFQNYNAMRYPDRSSYPRIPAEMYSGADAKTAFQVAEMIVNAASEKVQL